MGAVCTLQIHHPDRAVAEALIRRVRGEVRRLEAMFSLYDRDSLLVRLNRSGVLEAPPPEFVELLQASHAFAEATAGIFDVTVQPLWTLYAEHFSRPNPGPSGPSEALVRDALARVGYARLKVGRDRIALPRGMAVTLNGIAQGFVTDKVVELLRSEGVVNSLVDMGETRAMGSHPASRPWDVAVADPDEPGHSVTVIPIIDRALATSGPYGFGFDSAGRYNHLFEPATGRCAERYKSVSVVARTATMADALSTAFCFMAPADILSVARLHEVDLVHLIGVDGGTSRIVA